MFVQTQNAQNRQGSREPNHYRRVLCFPILGIDCRSFRQSCWILSLVPAVLSRTTSHMRSRAFVFSLTRFQNHSNTFPLFCCIRCVCVFYYHAPNTNRSPHSANLKGKILPICLVQQLPDIDFACKYNDIPPRHRYNQHRTLL